ncbi:MAG: response regulator transcription factor [Bacteroidetes bacterium]|nr:response regulator transcription factor [Bacteroidota bacterium]
MNSIKAIIVDDEPLLIDTVQSILNKFCKDVDIVATANDAFDAKAKIEKFQPDLVFLDINMPKVNGIDLLRSFGERNFDVVFITAYSEFAIDALRQNAIHYLLKPILSDELIQAVDRVRENMRNREAKNGAAEPEMIPGNQKQRIVIQNNNTYLFLDDKDILWLEADSNYTKIYLVSGKTISSAKTIKYYEALLSKEVFFRIHKSYIINTQYISEYIRDNKGPLVILNENIKLRVAQPKQASFRKFMIMRGRMSSPLQ